MRRVNESSEWSNCVHPNAMPGAKCLDCRRRCRCTIRQANVFIEAIVPALEDGEPDLSSIAVDYYIPDTSHFCSECCQEFRSWERLFDHIREGTA